MLVKKISLKNIRSYEDAELSFPDGSILLSGDIGTGKSSILLALEFALFGLQRGNLSGNGLLRKGEDTGNVKVELDVDGRNVLIERTLKRNKTSVNQDKSVLHIDNERFELSADELKQKVLDMLGYPAEFLKKTNLLYRYTVYTPQEEMRQILLEDAETRINTLRRIFGIDKYKLIEENLNVIATKIKENIKNKEGKIADLGERKEDLRLKNKDALIIQDELEKLEPKIQEVHKKLDGKREILQKFEEDMKKFQQLKTDIVEKKAHLRQMSGNLENVTDNINNSNIKIDLLKGELQNKQKEDIERIKQQLQQNQKLIELSEKSYILTEKKISSIETEIKKIEKSAKELTELSICPTCKQQVTEEHKHNIGEESKKELENKKLDLELLYSKKSESEANLNLLKEEFLKCCDAEKAAKLLEFKIKELEEKLFDLKRFENQKLEIFKKITEEKNFLDKLEEKLPEFGNLEDNYHNSRKAIELVQIEERDLAIKKAEFERELRGISKELAEIEKQIEEKENIATDAVYLKKLSEWLSEHFTLLINTIEKSVMQTVHREFSSLFEKWFVILAENLNARLDENFTPIIEQQGYELDYDFLSGGERTAAALAYRLALNQVLNNLMGKLKTY
ncbi:SMC family ATPase, partial [Candidatus Pacearchaeota archaeon]|nr:SMC family ATPase [Candidatus Pacearchaeota archaeon]